MSAAFFRGYQPVTSAPWVSCEPNIYLQDMIATFTSIQYEKLGRPKPEAPNQYACYNSVKNMN